MHFPAVNYLSVLVSGIVIFFLGGLWYSKLLFAKPWVKLMGKSEEDLKAGSGPMGLQLFGAFICGLLIAYVIAIILNHFRPLATLRGIEVGVACWVGFAAPTSFANALFTCKPKALWAIDSGYNLVSFAIAGAIIGWWPWM